MLLFINIFLIHTNTHIKLLISHAVIFNPFFGHAIIYKPISCSCYAIYASFLSHAILYKFFSGYAMLYKPIYIMPF